MPPGSLPGSPGIEASWLASWLAGWPDAGWLAGCDAPGRSQAGRLPTQAGTAGSLAGTDAGRLAGCDAGSLAGTDAGTLAPRAVTTSTWLMPWHSNRCQPRDRDRVGPDAADS